MILLLHSIPRPVLRSIVMRMVAHDFWERDSENRKLLYDAEGPGAYIATVSVVGRNGCGWSIMENRQIVECLEMYARAIELKERDDDHYGGSQYCDDDVAAFLVSMEVDKVYRTRPTLEGDEEDEEEDGESDGKSDEEDDVEADTTSSADDTTTEDSESQDYPMPRFASSSRRNKSRHIRQLIEILKKRNDPYAPQNEPCKQSFCMVGNSDDVEKRKQNHRLIGNLTNSAHLWGLLVSCLKYMDLEAQDTIVPICKAWQLDHINLSEILLTVLTGSLVSVGGLNVKRPGTKSEKHPPSHRAFEGCRLHVWRFNPWFEENLVHSYPQISNLVDAEAELERSSQADLERLLDDVHDARQERDLAWEQFENLVQSVQPQIEDALREAEKSLQCAEIEDDELMGFLAFEDPVDEDASARPSAGSVPDRTRHASV
ncbi:hypothetical protein F4818DRAFT_416845 [Hypoxylon cercidicola]|nr:hypothetical protein F4818DRAFT_416845 [Hypoxylon cercidicola]